MDTGETPAIATAPGSVQDSSNVYQGARGGYVVPGRAAKFPDGRARTLRVLTRPLIGAAFQTGWQTLTTATGFRRYCSDSSLDQKVSGDVCLLAIRCLSVGWRLARQRLMSLALARQDH